MVTCPVQPKKKYLYARYKFWLVLLLYLLLYTFFIKGCRYYLPDRGYFWPRWAGVFSLCTIIFLVLFQRPFTHCPIEIFYRFKDPKRFICLCDMMSAFKTLFKEALSKGFHNFFISIQFNSNKLYWVIITVNTLLQITIMCPL